MQLNTYSYQIFTNIYFQAEGDDKGFAYRGLFIIDGEGNIRQITINNMAVGRNADETLRLVQALRFTDAKGLVCPAGWKKGKKAMEPSKEGLLNYLSTLTTEA